MSTTHYSPVILTSNFNY